MRVDLFYDARYAHTRMSNPDFIALAKAMRIHAIRCERAEDLPAKMKEFLEYDDSKPVLMECVVEKNEHVFPMVCCSYALYCIRINELFVGARGQGSPRADRPPYVPGGVCFVQQKAVNTC